MKEMMSLLDESDAVCIGEVNRESSNIACNVCSE